MWKNLKLTTRDIPDYDELMTKRLSILKENNFKLTDIKDVISHFEPLDGAIEFHKWLQIRVRSNHTFRYLLSICKSFNEEIRLPNAILSSISH